MLREIISRCKTIKYCADNFTQDFGLDYFFFDNKLALLSKNEKIANVSVENHKIILAC